MIHLLTFQTIKQCIVFFCNLGGIEIFQFLDPPDPPTLRKIGNYNFPRSANKINKYLDKISSSGKICQFIEGPKKI